MKGELITDHDLILMRDRFLNKGQWTQVELIDEILRLRDIVNQNTQTISGDCMRSRKRRVKAIA